MASIRPFDQGARAHKDGEPVTGNPYDLKEQPTSHLAWNRGWEAHAEVARMIQSMGADDEH